jgi:methylated-DNA-protein-cysteine methyltransferase related protein
LENNFFSDVYDVVRLIPEGRVSSYGAIARYLGTGGSARMVGWALNSCTDPTVPAHRVVNRQGLLTGKMHFGAGDAMASRLEAEGIRVSEDRVLQFDSLFWDPARELNL